MVASGRLPFSTALLLLGLTVLPLASAGAQARPVRSPSVLLQTWHHRFTPAMGWAEPDTTKHIHATYWKEGALIGGGVGVVAGAFVFHGLCEDDDSAGHTNCFLSALGGALTGAILLGVPGALIGGSFDKGPPADFAKPAGDQ